MCTGTQVGGQAGRPVYYSPATATYGLDTHVCVRAFDLSIAVRIINIAKTASDINYLNQL